MTTQITYFGCILTCLRCPPARNTWLCRIATRPVACPRCHSTRWDIPRRERKEKDANAGG